MSMTSSCDVVTIGAYTKDTIVTKSGTRYVNGGGYSYAAHAARLAVPRVGAVTRLATADRDSTNALRGIGVDVRIYDSPASTLMRLEYPTDDVDQRILTVAATADPFAVEHVAGLDSRAFLVSASIRGEVPLAVMQALAAKGALLGADIQGFVRVVGANGRLAYEAWPEQRDVLALVRVLKSDAVEAEFVTGHADIHRAAAALAEFGPSEIVLTHRDGVLVRASGREYEAPFKPREMRGRSGRGDTCIGSYLARRLDHEPHEATLWAAAVTSLKLEAEGPVHATVADVVARTRELAG
jgi:sugar/nucleoside kinase (ribokinase family)